MKRFFNAVFLGLEFIILGPLSDRVRGYYKLGQAELVRAEYRRRVELAKKEIHTTYQPGYDGRSMLHVENPIHIAEILQFKLTLGMHLFIRDYIGKQKDTESCVDWLISTERHLKRN